MDDALLTGDGHAGERLVYPHDIAGPGREGRHSFSSGNLEHQLTRQQNEDGRRLVVPGHDIRRVRDNVAGNGCKMERILGRKVCEEWHPAEDE